MWLTVVVVSHFTQPLQAGDFLYHRNMKVTYVVTYDLERDINNWTSAAKSPVSHGFNWYDNLHNDADRRMFKDLQILPPPQAEAKLEKYIQRTTQSEAFTTGQKFIQKRYKQDFQKACEWLEKVTKRPLAFSRYITYLTTFPRGSYYPDDGYLLCHYTWINPVIGFMHEALHIQFHKYWRNNPASPVSKLSDQDWETLKESLTVILNKKYVDFIEMNDRGYAQHQEFREELWRQWEKEQDFDKLVEYGVREVTKFTKK